MRVSGPLVEPPEGVLAGDDVPIENQQDDLDVAQVDHLVALLKIRPGYRGRDPAELREIAKEKLQ